MELNKTSTLVVKKWIEDKRIALVNKMTAIRARIASSKVKRAIVKTIFGIKFVNFFYFRGFRIWHNVY